MTPRADGPVAVDDAAAAEAPDEEMGGETVDVEMEFVGNLEVEDAVGSLEPSIDDCVSRTTASATR